MNLFIKKKCEKFIQRIYLFKKNENYSFKENIHSSEKWIIAQGYPWAVPHWSCSCKKTLQTPICHLLLYGSAVILAEPLGAVIFSGWLHLGGSLGAGGGAGRCGQGVHPPSEA